MSRVFCPARSLCSAVGKGPFPSRSLTERESGFTLIEIVTVLIIIGVLAAISVPKYMSVAEDARQKAVEGALSTGVSSCSLAFARLTLSYGNADFTMNELASACGSPGGTDFTFKFRGIEPESVLIEAESVSTGKTTSKEWTVP